MTKDVPPIVFTKHLKREQEGEIISLLSFPTLTNKRVGFFFFLIRII